MNVTGPSETQVSGCLDISGVKPLGMFRAPYQMSHDKQCDPPVTSHKYKHSYFNRIGETFGFSRL